MLTLRPLHKRVLFLFALYLFFAMAAVALDPHGALPSKTCAICFMRTSLSSVINQSYVIPEVFYDEQYAFLAKDTCWCYGSITFPGMSYRGPPLAASSL